MKHIRDILMGAATGMYKSVARFPLTVLFLLCATLINCYFVSLDDTPPLLLWKLDFTLFIGVSISIALQFTIERVEKLRSFKLQAIAAALILTAGYFMIIRPAPEMTDDVQIRSFVAIVAIMSFALWVPSYRRLADFNKVALIHFKSFFTSLLASGVLYAGLAGIIGTIDVLLFNVDNDAYAYMAIIVWNLFAAIYYLSLLPAFNSEEEADVDMVERSSSYPRFLDILVSRIMISLMGGLSIVLIIYFIKILATQDWPSGRLGPIGLSYSAAGIVIYVLAGLLENRMARLYRLIFPKVLILVVAMQLVSAFIRINAYGFTEGRYYMVVVGAYSLAMAILLSIKPVSRNAMIALVGSCMAIMTIIPPVDAFTVSRNSQISRVESMLAAEGMLKDGTVVKNADASENTRVETTNILTYLDRTSSLRYIEWLPDDFDVYRDFKGQFGFDMAYRNEYEETEEYYYLSADMTKPYSVSGYDISVDMATTGEYAEKMAASGQPVPAGANPYVDMAVGGKTYKLAWGGASDGRMRIGVTDASGTEVVGTDLYEFVQKVKGTTASPKELMKPEEMTVEASRKGYKLKVVFTQINGNTIKDKPDNVNLVARVLFSAPQ